MKMKPVGAEVTRLKSNKKNETPYVVSYKK
jgi:hypothetical protein